jgi:amidase
MTELTRSARPSIPHAGIADLTVAQLRRHLVSRELSALEVLTATLERIEAENGSLGAFLAVAADQALEASTAADRRARNGALDGPLHGIPVAIKDLQETRGIPTSYGLRTMRAHLPAADAVIVERLRRAGAVIVGKTNTPALGALGETTGQLGECRNPWDTRLTPGGSSGGSAAAVAAHLVPVATGTDSAGSISCPAAFCGVVGIKPSRGRIPYWPFDDAVFLNHAGPIARTVEDATLVLEAVAGPDQRDPVSIRDTVGPLYSASLGGLGDTPLKGLRVAWTPDLGGHFNVDAGVSAVAERAAERLAALGADVESACPATEDPFEVYMPIYATAFRSSLSRLDEASREEILPETWDELSEYQSLTAEQLLAALVRRYEFRARMTSFFDRYDVLVSPATGCTAFPLREPPARIGGRDVSPGWRSFMPFQVPWNLTGQPTITLAGGLCDGLPVGVLMVGAFARERTVLRVAHAFEQAAPGWRQAASRQPSSTRGEAGSPRAAEQRRT